eukprot:CAMPEP_0194034774 /NCGR_PEP_ID=MMETSP0009_2-20130614/7193_1 /TAXON_ID=210454 /ORGANISM="Grammatophora oceanica, Strain CCMP 410" /LENGTH=326 /DNA_ID=CAMNT_0038675829 /DNA_START=37 /DNA_END=1017 /DNA_ORIENTATION=-
MVQTRMGDCGGLSHLVEAATVLSNMVDARPTIATMTITTATNTDMRMSQLQQRCHSGRQDTPSQPSPSPTKTVVSDDDNDDSRRAAPSPTKLVTSNRDRKIFPQLLHALLKDTSLSEIVSWLPHGRSFVIMKPDAFANCVLPKFFPSNDSKSPKYPSFTRKLNRWGFRQATRGPDTGAFHHPLFRRDEPHLCKDMICQKGSRKRRSTHIPTTVQTRQPKVLASLPCGAVTSLTTEALTAFCASNGSQRSSVVQVSGDDRSVTSSATSLGENPPLLQPTSILTSMIPTDPSLVASTLKKRDEREKLNVYKSLLYDAYVKALRANGKS